MNTRLHSGTSQQIFRVLLSALSQPGKIHALPSRPDQTSLPMAMRPLLAMAHRGLGIAVIDEQAWQHEVCAVTAARAAAPAEAQLVVSLSGLSAGTAHALSRGTALEPESGAQVYVGCQWLSDLPKAVTDGLALRLVGPGIADVVHLWVGGLDVEAIAARNESCRDFPMGFDMWLIDPSGRVCGLPRSTQVTILSGGVGDDLDH